MRKPRWRSRRGRRGGSCDSQDAGSRMGYSASAALLYGGTVDRCDSWDQRLGVWTLDLSIEEKSDAKKACAIDGRIGKGVMD